MRYLTTAVDTVRKREHRALASAGDMRLARSKYLWLYSAENLPERYGERFAALRAVDLKTGRAWAIKESLRALWDYQRRGWAERHWTRWYAWATRSRLGPVIKAAQTGGTNGKADIRNSMPKTKKTLEPQQERSRERKEPQAALQAEEECAGNRVHGAMQIGGGACADLRGLRCIAIDAVHKIERVALDRPVEKDPASECVGGPDPIDDQIALDPLRHDGDTARGGEGHATDHEAHGDGRREHDGLVARLRGQYRCDRHDHERGGRSRLGPPHETGHGHHDEQNKQRLAHAVGTVEQDHWV